MTQRPAETTRFQQLDALRGLAALSVVLFHYHLLFERGTVYDGVRQVIDVFQLTPLYFFIAGDVAVLVFFVLSGFVLTYMWQRGGTYLTYMVRRVCRLYLPYLVTVLLAIGLNAWLYRGPIADLGSAFNPPWSGDITWNSILHHLLFVTSFDTVQYNYVIWSLVHEMRISIIFPIVLALVLRLGWKLSLGGSLLLSLTAGAGFFLLIDGPLKGWVSYLLTLHYLIFFVIGALLAVHRQVVLDWYAHLGRGSKIGLAALCVASYTYGYLPERFGLGNPVPNDLLALPGATLVVVFALCSQRVSALLQRPIPLFLGRISYSLYLLHVVVMLAALHAFYGSAPIWLILLGSFVVTIVASELVYRLVEQPSIDLGRRLTRGLARPSKGEATKESVARS